MILPSSVHFARVVGLSIFLGTLVFFGWGIKLQHNEEVVHSRLLALTFASSLRAGVDRELNALLNLTASLASYLEIKNGRVDDAEINAMLANLYNKSRHVHNFGVAVDRRLTYVYPLAGNEPALGLYYPDAPAQWPAVQRAIGSGSGTLAGPVPLVQGGSGLIYRVPVQIDGKYWGLLSTVIDAPALFQSARHNSVTETYEFAVRGRDGLGAEGGIFLGDPRLFDDASAVQLLSEVPGGKWIYAVRPHPVSWWSGAKLVAHALALTISALLGFFAFKFQQHRHDLSLAARLDPLTQLINRREFQVLLRAAMERRRKLDQPNLALMFLDLDRFKYINDTYGHSAGDTVLITVAERMRQILRAGDVIGRWGGDELVILINDCAAEIPEQVQTRLREVAGKPIVFDGHQLQIGVAVGLAYFPQDGDSAETLLRVADERMYRDKQINLLAAT